MHLFLLLNWDIQSLFSRFKILIILLYIRVIHHVMFLLQFIFSVNLLINFLIFFLRSSLLFCIGMLFKSKQVELVKKFEFKIIFTVKLAFGALFYELVCFHVEYAYMQLTEGVLNCGIWNIKILISLEFDKLTYFSVCDHKLFVDFFNFIIFLTFGDCQRLVLSLDVCSWFNLKLFKFFIHGKMEGWLWIWRSIASELLTISHSRWRTLSVSMLHIFT